MNKAVKKDSTPVASPDTEVDAFLAAAKSFSPPSSGVGRLMFVLDATMSRQPTWDRATSIQAEMFAEAARTGGLAVQLVWFRGINECRAGRWTDRAEDLQRQMARVSCRAGATQLGRVIRHALVETRKTPLAALVYVGDACEESPDPLLSAAGELGVLGTKVFMFQEGCDPMATEVFQGISRLTGGCHVMFDPASAVTLRRLLAAVAAYAAGGVPALESYHRRTGTKVLALAPPGRND